MLKKRERLTTKQFNECFRSGARYHSQYFQLVHAPSPTFHAAVVVGKKVAGKATARNRLRRQLYGRLYHLHTSTGLRGTFILIAKPPLRSLPQRELTPALTDIVGQVVKSR